MKVQLPLADYIRINEPLLWDVLDGDGHLLLRKGSIPTDRRLIEGLVERGVYVDQREFENFLSLRAEPERFDPFAAWDEVHRRVALVLRAHLADERFAGKIALLAEELDALIDKDPDAAIYFMCRLEQSNYTIAHSLQTAIVAALIGRHCELSPDERAILPCSALTMNIGMFDLQRVLARQLTPLSEAQQAQIREHPQRSAAILRDKGVDDTIWLRAVTEHHETADGRGYPLGIKEISPAASLIHLADMYCAMLSARAGRPALLPNEAARRVYTVVSPELQALAAVLVRDLGIYPPGSFVRLANGDIAVVVKRGAQANRPLVASVMSGRGVKLTDPIRRDTAKPEFAIVAAVAGEQVALGLDPLRLFGLRMH